ncbi:hypothetical protein ABKN59_010738 [Abortiporus biennis]
MHSIPNIQALLLSFVHSGSSIQRLHRKIIQRKRAPTGVQKIGA